MKFKIIPCVFLFTTLCVSIAYAKGQNGEYLLYEELIKQIRLGNVKSINLGNYSTISGTYLADGVEKLFLSRHDSDAANDPLLLNLLYDKNVKINLEEKSNKRNHVGYGEMTGILLYGFLALFLFFGVPIVTLINLVKINKKLQSLSEIIEKMKQGAGS